MKKYLIAFFMTLVACSAGAVSIDQEGRKWITADEINVDSASPQGKFITKENVKLEIANWNTWVMCTLPDIWNAEDPDEKLEQFSQSKDPDEYWQYAVYIRENYRIWERYYGDEPNYEELLTGGRLSYKYNQIIDSLSEQERKATLVSNCEDDWGKIMNQKRRQLGYND